MTELPASFGKYFLTEKIATGGMAEIYLAKLVGPGGFEKQLVIKQIHPSLSDQAAFVDLFVAEAKTLVSLGHGNIVPIYELGVIDGVYFIAMEYIDGPTLDRLQRRLAARGQAMAPAVAAYVLAEILKGLDYAHRKGAGVIHRDLSPRNVMLSRDGEVKLVDFGIAVPLEDERAPAEGAPVGSYPYMSPEQVRGARLTGQSDVFSAGVLFWEMLTGARLFARATPEDTLAAVTGTELEAPSALRAEVPAALDEICLRALARDPAARYPSATACLADVQRYLYSLDELVSPARLAQMVARLCPPERHRAGSEAETADTGGRESNADARAPDGDADGTVPLPRPQPTDQGDGTVPLPRPQSADQADGTAPLPRPGRPDEPDRREGTVPAPRPARARGKQRARTEQTFATHIEIERVLSGTAEATPPYPGPAERAGMAGDGDRERADEAGGGDRAGAGEAAAGGDDVGHADELSVPAEQARRRRPWMVAVSALGVVLAAGLVVVMFARGDARVPSPAHPGSTAEDGLGGPAATALVKGSARATSTAEMSAAGPDAGVFSDVQTSATPPAPGQTSAGLDTPRDQAASPPRPTTVGTQAAPTRATPTTRPSEAADAGRKAEVGVGTLKVGANPWGEVYLDGERLGRAPNAWPVPAGAHRVEVVFPVGEPPPRRRFEIRVGAGETVSVGVVDFTDAASSAR
ncbi:protein kinase domain-containing protein [Haliangium sp.]|uniref:serine/threonine-protein kinase n=1 Tax=Haliangium sp. TaxID=2663208 RepID=UPI003D0C7182